MTDTHEVISAFLDDEPFEPQALAEALADPAGRSLLIDLVAMRHLVQPAHNTPPLAAARSARFPLRGLVTAAAMLIALAGGYLAGQDRSAADGAPPPAPTRIVEAPATWEEPSTPIRSTP
jgi:hypothetical protein